MPKTPEKLAQDFLDNLNENAGKTEQRPSTQESEQPPEEPDKQEP
jgi:hypothetical protein